MFKSTYFTFDGRSSEEFNVVLCNIDTGLVERPFGINRSIINETTPYNPLPYDFGYQTNVLAGEFQLSRCEGVFSTQDLAKIAEWLFQDDYKPFISNENPDVVYYIKFTEDQTSALTAKGSGYLSLSFTANAPWAWSKKQEYIFDFSKSTSPQYFNIDNYSNNYEYNGLEIELKMSSIQDDRLGAFFSIRNTRNTLPENAFCITDYYIGNILVEKYKLINDETIYIHMGNHEVLSDIDTIPSRLLNCNKEWITLEKGINKFEFKGNGILSIRYQHPILI